jgi:hypothetical protein
MSERTGLHQVMAQIEGQVMGQIGPAVWKQLPTSAAEQCALAEQIRADNDRSLILGRVRTYSEALEQAKVDRYQIIVQASALGCSLAQIAGAAGLSRQRVQRILHPRPPVPPMPPVPDF